MKTVKEEIELLPISLKIKPPKVNFVELSINEKDRAEIIPLGDIHAGYPTFDQAKFEETIEVCLAEKIYVIGMGDYIDLSTKVSPGHSIFEQWSPNKQIDYILNWYGKLAKENLLLGLLEGNHELRLTKICGVDITKYFAQMLGTKYFGWAMFHDFKVGKEHYVLYTVHGASGARLVYTKLKSILDLFKFVNVEIICMGHLHEKDTLTSLYYEIDRRNKTVLERKRYAVLTGHFLKYPGSYAEEMNLPPSKTGVAKIRLEASEHKITVSI